ncbi:hypothetical protein ACTXW1_002641 [Enterococcus hirae]
MNKLKVIGTQKIGNFEFVAIEGGFGEDKKARRFYHMNEKIENLIEELANECEKESLGLSLAVADDECVAIKIAGPANLYAISILEQRNIIKKSFRSNCNCEECQTFRRGVLKYQKEMVFHLMEESELLGEFE